MRGAAVPLAVFAALTMLVGLGSGTAAAAGPRKLVEGTVYDATCTVAGDCASPCPPPCGPIPLPGGARSDFVCAQPQRRIACPLAQSSQAGASPDLCLQGLPCGVSYPIYSGEGGSVLVRRRGAMTPLAEVPVVEGHFKARLGPGEYVLRAELPEAQCWSGTSTVEVTGRMRSPVIAALEVANACVAHPGGAR